MTHRGGEFLLVPVIDIFGVRIDRLFLLAFHYCASASTISELRQNGGRVGRWWGHQFGLPFAERFLRAAFLRMAFLRGLAFGESRACVYCGKTACKGEEGKGGYDDFRNSARSHGSWLNLSFRAILPLSPRCLNVYVLGTGDKIACQEQALSGPIFQNDNCSRVCAGDINIKVDIAN